MKVILLKKVPELGDRLDVVEVTDDFARDALFSKGLAEVMTAEDMTRLIEHKAKAKASVDDDRFTEELIAQKFFKLVGFGNGVHQIEFLPGHEIKSEFCRFSAWHFIGSKLYLGWPGGNIRALKKDPEMESHWISVEGELDVSLRLLPALSVDHEIESTICATRRYWCTEGGGKRRNLILLPDGTVGPGSTPQIRTWVAFGGELHFMGEKGFTASLKPTDKGFSGKTLEFPEVTREGLISLEPDTERRHYIVHGLQRTCTNLVQIFFSNCVQAPRQIKFFDVRYWKHGWLPSRKATKDTFVIICVRHPLDWLVACYEYFLQEYGKDGSICPHFHNKWSFEDFLNNEHYVWTSPIERWNTMNQHWLTRINDVGASGGIIVKAEDFQSPYLQEQTFRILAHAYDPFMAVDVATGVVSGRVTNVGRVTTKPMDSSKYWEQQYLRYYTPELLDLVKGIVDPRLMKQLGYEWPEKKD